MNKTFVAAILALFSILGAASCSSDNANRTSNNSSTSNTSNTSTVNALKNGVETAVNSVSNAVTGRPTEEDFWNKAAEGGMAEVELSKLAQTKSQNADVKKFAQMMITDHTKANTELKALAAKKNVTLPTALSSSHKSTLDKLGTLSGADFDKAYVDAMVSDHNDAVSLFQTEGDGGTDPDLKAFAAKTLPTLKSHQTAIKDIKSKMK
jgi:putative membrane protein